ncbi:hypothetical protein ES708_34182 [subsurface metagenome]
MMLWDIIELAGRENVYYCDTDSLIVNRRGSERCSGLVHRSELGKLKLVQKTRRVVLHNVKDYKLAGKVKIKGISKTAKKVGKNEYITFQQQGIRTGLRNKQVNTVTWRRVPKKLSRLYEKGIVEFDEHVYPLIMLYSVGENWLDFEAMLDVYGTSATYRGRYLDDIMKRTLTVRDFAETSLEDYSPADRQQRAADNLAARRAGEMIYQRGR